MHLLQSGVASAERVFELLDEPDQTPEADPADPGVDLVLCSDRRLVAIGRQSRVWLCS